MNSGNVFSLRYLRLWQAIGLCLVALVVYLSLTSDPPSMETVGGDKVGHFLAYLTLMAWHVQIYCSPLARLKLALAFVALGVMLEFLQGLTGVRTPDVYDGLAGIAGVLSGWLLAATRFDSCIFNCKNPIRIRFTAVDHIAFTVQNIGSCRIDSAKAFPAEYLSCRFGSVCAHFNLRRDEPRYCDAKVRL
jgi:VanZ family protein